MKKIIHFLSYIRYVILIFLRFVLNRKENRIVIMATPTHGNLGDQAIVYAEKKIIKAICPTSSIIEIENGAYIKCNRIIGKFIRTTDIIIIDGGGNLGTIWPWEDDKITKIIEQFKYNKIVVFPQTVHYDISEFANQRIENNKKIYEQARDLTFLLRDSASFDFFAQTFPNTNFFLCPDIVLSLNKRQQLARESILLCFRSDRESILEGQDVVHLKQCLIEHGLSYSETDTVIKKTVKHSNRKRVLHKKWRVFSSAKLIITDRLHAMIFAFITGTPCIAINNSSKKVEGSFQFIKGCNYIRMAENLQEAMDVIPMMSCVKMNQSDAFVYPFSIIEEVLTNGDKE